MTKFFLLTKVFFLSSFAVNKKKNSQKPIFIKLALLGGLFFLISIAYNYFQFLQYSVQGMDYRGILLFVLSISAFLVFILTFNQMENMLFSGRDYDFISSLPVKNSTVIAAKIASVILISIAEDLIIFVPTIVFYQIYSNDTTGTIMSAIAVLFIAFIPLLISSILGTLIGLITKKLKNKTVFQIIMYLLYFILVFMLSFSINNSRLINPDIMLKVLPYLYFYKDALYTGNFVSILIYVAINILAFVIVVAMISLLYRPMHAVKNNTGNGKYVNTNEKGLDVKKALFKKEFKMITGKAYYLINSILGCFIYPIISIMLCVVNFAPEASEAAQNDVSFVMIGIIPVMGIIMNSMANSATTAFSLEGKNFELLLSYPLNPKDVITAKAKVGFIIPSVLNVIASTIVTVFLFVTKKIDLSQWIFILLVYLAPQLSLLFSTIVGTLCNLRWPKLEFENDMQVMKNSQSVLFAMLICTLPSFVASGIVFGLSFVSYLASLIALIVIYIIAILISFLILKNKGVELYNKIISR